MKTTVTFSEFRQHAADYFDAVEDGKTIRVKRHNKIIAVISQPTNESKKVPAWKLPATPLVIKGLSLTKEILKDRGKGR